MSTGRKTKALVAGAVVAGALASGGWFGYRYLEGQVGAGWGGFTRYGGSGGALPGCCRWQARERRWWLAAMWDALPAG